MSLEKYSSLNKRGDEYIAKVFFDYKRHNPGDSITVISKKDGKETTETLNVVAGQMLEKARFYVVLRLWKEEEEEVAP